VDEDIEIHHMCNGGVQWIKIFLYLAVLLLMKKPENVMGQNSLFLDTQNDFLNYKGDGTDKYFTAGISLGNCIDLKKNGSQYLVISLNQKMYTPSNIVLRPEELNPLDYPYAGLTYLSVGYVVFNESNTAYTKGAFSWGTTGPSSGAKMIQRELHKIIGDREPMGWSTQLQLGNFVQTNIEHTRSYLNKNWVKVNMTSSIELGSIFNNITLAPEFKLDKNKDPFIGFYSKRISTNKKPHLSIWAKPKFHLIIANCMLQTNQNPSGCFPRTINKFIYQSSVGISLQIKNLSISLIQHNNTPEFKSATRHAFGEIALQLNL
jgi:hypothetical protein